MAISLIGQNRANFIADLKAHREASPLPDLGYATETLQVSLNTFKKCMQSKGRTPLSLHRQTFINICKNANLDPQKYGFSFVVPNGASLFGGYHKHDFQDLCCRYRFYRRSFLSARDITCGVLEIHQNAKQEHLSFREEHHYVAEGGTVQNLYYTGDVYINRDRNLLSLPAFEDGQVRLMQLQPERLGGGDIKMRGALLTFGSPRGRWEPTVSCILANGPIDKKIKSKDLCGIIKSGSIEFDALAHELENIENYATNITPLMWTQNNSRGDKLNDRQEIYEREASDRRHPR